MIRKLRLKFIGMAMGVVLIVFAVMLLTLNLFMRESSVKETERLLAMVIAQDGIIVMPQPAAPIAPNDGNAAGSISLKRASPDRMTLSGGRFFYGKFDHGGVIIDLFTDMMFDLTRDETLQYLNSAAELGGESGTMDGLRYRSVEKEYGRMVVFAETRQATGMLKQLFNVSIWVAGGSFFALLAASILLSKWIAAPVKAAFERQRRFVSDAGHELKTPLTVLSANADVLENEIGENIWLGQIRAQTVRMSLLIHDLLDLAKADENCYNMQMTEFDWSRAVLSTALEFESRAFEEGKRFCVNVCEGINGVGDQSCVKRVMGILLDNALRHSGTGAEINVDVKTENGKIMISVYNTGTGVREEEYGSIFERFYRSDTSRSRETGGYGLGLAIAKTIVEAHKGTIAVEGEYGKWIRFTVIVGLKP